MIDDWEAMIRRIVSELEGLELLLKNRDEELSDASEEVDRLTNELEGARSDIQGLERELEEAREEQA